MKAYTASNGRVIRRAADGRFRHSTIIDLGVPSHRIAGRSGCVCQRCGERWFPVLTAPVCRDCVTEIQSSGERFFAVEIVDVRAYPRTGHVGATIARKGVNLICGPASHDTSRRQADAVAALMNNHLGTDIWHAANLDLPVYGPESLRVVVREVSTDTVMVICDPVDGFAGDIGKAVHGVLPKLAATLMAFVPGTETQTEDTETATDWRMEWTR